MCHLFVPEPERVRVTYIVAGVHLSVGLSQNFVRAAVRPLIVGASTYLNGKKMLWYRCVFHRIYFTLCPLKVTQVPLTFNLAQNFVGLLFGP